MTHDKSKDWLLLEFEEEEIDCEHADSTTTVEKIELTPDIRKAFREAGYVIEEDDDD